MDKILDRYYLVWLRHFDKWGFGRLAYSITGILGGSLTFNIFTLVLLFAGRVIYERENALWLLVGAHLIILFVLTGLLDVRYGKERRQRLREQYADEGTGSRRRAVFGVAVYEVLTFAAFFGVMFL